MKLIKNKIVLTILILILAKILYVLACDLYFHKTRRFTIANFSGENLQVIVYKGDEFIFDFQIDASHTQTVTKYVPRQLPYRAIIKGETFNSDVLAPIYDEAHGYRNYSYGLINYIVITENKEVIFQELIPVE